MLAIVETQVRPKTPGLFTFFRRKSSAYGHIITQRTILGMHTLGADLILEPAMKTAKQNRLVDCMLSDLEQAGADEVIFPSEHDFSDRLSRFGLRRVARQPVLLGIADKAAEYVISASGKPCKDMTAVICASRMNERLLRATDSICGKMRNLAICCGRDSGAVCERLRREFGVPALNNPSSEILSVAGLYLIYDADMSDISCKTESIAILLDSCLAVPPRSCKAIDGVLLKPPDRLREDAPAAADLTELISALLSHGALNIRDLEIESVTFGGNTVQLD